MKRLAGLEDMPVVTEDGSHLGWVFEIRSPGKAETEPTYSQRSVDCLLCGKRGLFERLGWAQRSPTKISWSDVLAVRTRDILVRGSAGDYASGKAR